MAQLKSSTVYGDVTITGSTTIKENLNVTTNAIVSGKIGIGTASPVDLLEVSASSDAAIRLSSTNTALGAGANIGSLVFYGNNATAPGAGIKARITAVTEVSAGDDAALLFTTSDGTTNNVERVRINSLGYVGIGTTTPSNKLTINANEADGLVIRSANTNFSDLRFGVSTSNSYTYIQSYRSGTGTSHPLTFWVDTTKVLEISSSTVTSNKPLALNAQNLTFNENGVRSWQMGVSYSSGNLTLQSGDYAGAFRLNTGLIFVDGKSASSTTFTSGSLGTGWKLDYNNSVSSKSYLEVDNILVRDTLRTHIFQKDVIKATNGQVYVSDSGIVADDYVGSNTIYLDVDKSATFSIGQILVCKDINLSTGLAISSVTMTVDSLGTEANGKQPYVVKDVVGTLSTIQKGMTIVRVSGGALLLDASTTSSPFMDVLYDRVTKTRIGNLAGVTSPTMGTLTGYGLWSENVYLEKNANIIGTLAVGGGSTIGNTFYVGKINVNNCIDSETGYFRTTPYGTSSREKVTDVGNPSSPSGYSLKVVQGDNVIRYAFNDPAFFASQRTVTVSVWARCAVGTVIINPDINDLALEERTTTTTWQRFSWTITVTTLLGQHCFIDINQSPGTVYYWGWQVEVGTQLSPYQKTDTTLSSSTGYGMWSTAGGFGGTIQNPVVTLNDYGLKILGVGTRTSLTANTIMIGNVIANGTPANMASSIRLANTGTNETSGLYGYDSSGYEKFALRLDGTSQIAGFSFGTGRLTNSWTQNIGSGIVSMNSINSTTSYGNNSYGRGFNVTYDTGYDAGMIMMGELPVAKDGSHNWTFGTTNATRKIGIAHYKYDSSTPYFEMSVTGQNTRKNVIAGWNFSTEGLYSSNLSGGSDGGYTTAGLLLHSTGYISAPKFSLSSGGVIKATDVDLTGKITASSGAIGGWSLTSSSISATGMDINSGANPHIAFWDQGNGTDYISIGRRLYDGAWHDDYNGAIFRYNGENWFQMYSSGDGATRVAQIAGWNFNGSRLESGGVPGGSSGFIRMSTASSNGYFYNGIGVLKGFSIGSNQSGTAQTIVMGQMMATGNTIKTNYMGIQMMGSGGEEYFALGTNLGGTSAVYNRIAGWAFDTTKIYNTSVGLQVGSGTDLAFWAGATDSAGTGAKVALRHDGSGYLANNNLSWDTSGNTTINGKVIINGKFDGNMLLDASEWTEGTGGVTGVKVNFNSNGNPSENSRSMGTDPYGHTSIIWRATADDAYGNGGWDTSVFPVIPTKKYRSIVFVRPVNPSGGIYLGCQGNTVKNSAGNVDDNPYFLVIDPSGLVTSDWYMFVGYIYPHTHTYTGNEDMGGVYHVKTGTKITGSQYFRFASSLITTNTQRVYQYYGSAGGIVDFWGPRVEECDGSEPDLLTLMTNAVGGWTTVSDKILSNNVSGTTDGSAYTSSGMVLGSSGYIASPNFRVSTGGNLYAQSADIAGKITASSGAVGGWDISTTYIASNGMGINSGTYPNIVFYDQGSGTDYISIGRSLYDGAWHDDYNGAIFRYNNENWFQMYSSGDGATRVAQIAGWNFNGTRLYKESSVPYTSVLSLSTADGPYDGNATYPYYSNANHLKGIMFTWHQANNAGHIVLGQMASNGYTKKSGYYGLQMMSYTGQEFFALGANTAVSAGDDSNYYNRIAGWAFNSSKIYSTNISGTADGSSYTITGMVIGSTGYIASPNFLLKEDGSALFKGTLSAPDGTIGGWAINNDKLYAGSGSNFVGMQTGIGATKTFFTGATDNIGTSAKICFNADGSGLLAGGKISWDTSGNASFKGTLEATSGTFSGVLSSPVLNTTDPSNGDTINVPSVTHWAGSYLATHTNSLGAGWYSATGTWESRNVTYFIKGSSNTVSYHSDDTEVIATSEVIQKYITTQVNGKVNIYVDIQKIGIYYAKLYLSKNGVQYSDYIDIPDNTSYTTYSFLNIDSVAGDVWRITYYGSKNDTHYLKNFRICPVDNSFGIWNNTNNQGYVYYASSYYTDIGNIVISTLSDFDCTAKIDLWSGLTFINYFDNKVGSLINQLVDVGTGSFLNIRSIYINNDVSMTCYFASSDFTIYGNSYYSYTGSIKLLNDPGSIKMFNNFLWDYEIVGSEKTLRILESNNDIFRLYANGKLQIAGLTHTTNSANLLVNATTSYGAWRVTGARNGYTGVTIGGAYNLTFMQHESAGHGGIYNESQSKWLIYSDGSIASCGYPLYGAVGNDYADIYKCDINEKDIKYRYVYVIDKTGKVRLSNKYNERGIIGIATNEFTFLAHSGDNEKSNKKITKKEKGIPISIGGFVSAVLDKSYPAGTPLVCGKEGKLTKARWYTRIFNSHSILGFILPDGRVRVL